GAPHFRVELLGCQPPVGLALVVQRRDPLEVGPVILELVDDRVAHAGRASRIGRPHLHRRNEDQNPGSTRADSWAHGPRPGAETMTPAPPKGILALLAPSSGPPR